MIANWGSTSINHKQRIFRILHFQLSPPFYQQRNTFARRSLLMYDSRDDFLERIYVLYAHKLENMCLSYIHYQSFVILVNIEGTFPINDKTGVSLAVTGGKGERLDIPSIYIV